MGFLDNSGDIILDAVLTDTGRKLLAKGDGSFRISKFALFDDEIDYGLFDSDHPSGSAYYDLEILQTPVFEAFTNNASSGKGMLLTIPRTNILYLPVLKVNDNIFSKQTINARSVFPVAVDEETATALETSLATAGAAKPKSFIRGYLQPSSFAVRIDQGLDTTAISYTVALDLDLKESAYILEMDSRFGSIYAGSAKKEAVVSYIDDDDIASYYLSTNDKAFVTENEGGDQVLAGPRGTTLWFSIASSLNLQGSDYYFNRYGKTVAVGGDDYLIIETSVRVSGATTGSSIVVPITYVKVA